VSEVAWLETACICCYCCFFIVLPPYHKNGTNNGNADQKKDASQAEILARIKAKTDINLKEMKE
jgi:hypothetical protein